MPSVTTQLSANGVLTLTLNRTDKHNALDAATIEELHAAILAAERNDAVRVVVLTGAGKTFCAGADINHMRAMKDAPEAQNLADASSLSRCLRALDELDRPVIVRVNGNAFGGGVGLVACGDIAIGVDTAKFALSEVRLGLVPATISPYVIAAVGAHHARRLFLTATAIGAHEAQQVGLLHLVSSPEELDATVSAQIDALLLGGPLAHRAAKRLIREVVAATNRDRLQDDTAQLLAKLRVTPEAREGLAAFLERRKPDWITANEGSK
jgi:methylglutaconyl-CoA hydratase